MREVIASRGRAATSIAIRIETAGRDALQIKVVVVDKTREHTHKRQHQLAELTGAAFPEGIETGTKVVGPLLQCPHDDDGCVGHEADGS